MNYDVLKIIIENSKFVCFPYVDLINFENIEDLCLNRLKHHLLHVNECRYGCFNFIKRSANGLSNRLIKRPCFLNRQMKSGTIKFIINNSINYEWSDIIEYDKYEAYIKLHAIYK